MPTKQNASLTPKRDTTPPFPVPCAFVTFSLNNYKSPTMGVVSQNIQVGNWYKLCEGTLLFFINTCNTHSSNNDRKNMKGQCKSQNIECTHLSPFSSPDKDLVTTTSFLKDKQIKPFVKK